MVSETHGSEIIRMVAEYEREAERQGNDVHATNYRNIRTTLEKRAEPNHDDWAACEECDLPVRFDNDEPYYKSPDDRFWHEGCAPEGATTDV